MFDDLNQKPGGNQAKDDAQIPKEPVDNKPNWPTPPSIPGVDNNSVTGEKDISAVSPVPPTPPVPIPESKEELAEPVPEDMFAETEPAKPAQFEPKAKSALVPSEEERAEKTAGFRLQKLLTMVAVVCVLLLLVIGTYWGIKLWLEKNPQEEASVPEEIYTTAEIEKNITANEEIPVENVIKTTPKPVIPAKSESDIDTDQDGLSDKEEKQVGSDPSKVDTDDDGLFDREEVQVYKTNPRNKDTDGDGFSDGDEVQNGYNPNGEGKLYSID